MANSVALGIAVLSMILMMAPVKVRSNSRDPDFVLFTRSVPGENIIPVAGPTPPRNDTLFGTIFVFDIPVTGSIDTDSPPVGRLQGIEVVASLNGAQRYAQYSVILDSGKYRGSTLQVQGTVKSIGNTFKGELSATSGTGSLRFNRGYVEVETVREIPTARTVINRLKFFLKKD